MKLYKLIILIYSILFIIGTSISWSQATAVMALDKGNEFFYNVSGWEYPNDNVSYNSSLVVVSDTLLNDTVWHKLSSGSFEYADSMVLMTMNGSGQRQIVCDFHWSVGDIVVSQETAPVVEKGSDSIFGELQQFMTMSDPGWFTRKFVKEFGVVYEYQVIPTMETLSTSLIGAIINGVTYGSIPTRVVPQKKVDNESSSKIFPVPTSGPMNIQLTLAHPSSYEIEVFNILGQRVGRILQGSLSAGTFVLHWTGFEDNQQALASGIYLVRSRLGDQITNYRVLLLR